METVKIIVYLIATIITTGATGLGALLAWRKWGPQTTDIKVGTADKVIKMTIEAGEFIEGQRDSLQEQLNTLSHRLNDLESKLQQERQENVKLLKENTHLRRVNTVLETRNTRLESRVIHLEQKVEELEREQGKSHD